MAVKKRTQSYYVIEVNGHKIRLYPPKGKKWIVKTYTPSPKTAFLVSKALWGSTSVAALRSQGKKAA